MLSSTPAEMDVNKENSGEESPTDWILNLDFNPEGVMLSFKFQTQKKPLPTKKVRKTSFK